MRKTLTGTKYRPTNYDCAAGVCVYMCVYVRVYVCIYVCMCPSSCTVIHMCNSISVAEHLSTNKLKCANGVKICSRLCCTELHM